MTTRYTISEAAKKVDVEAHVLRYWEVELELDIGRNELGHRFYTEEELRLFENIKGLKERGMQLKGIKILIPELKKQQDSEREEPKERIISSEDVLPVLHMDLDKMKQFEEIMGTIFKQILQDNNVELESRITDTMIKEMDLLLQLREEREEERFRRLDASIRAHQKKRSMVAATKEPGSEQKKKRFFFWRT